MSENYNYHNEYKQFASECLYGGSIILKSVKKFDTQGNKKYGFLIEGRGKSHHFVWIDSSNIVGHAVEKIGSADIRDYEKKYNSYDKTPDIYIVAKHKYKSSGKFKSLVGKTIARLITLNKEREDRRTVYGFLTDTKDYIVFDNRDPDGYFIDNNPDLIRQDFY